MNSLTSKNSFIRLIIFTFKSVFKSFKLYVFMLLLPIIYYLFSYLYNNNFDKIIINPAIMLNKLFLPSIFSIFFATSLIFDWNNTMFNKYLNIFKLKKSYIIISLITIFIILNIIFLLLFIVVTSLLDLFFINRSMLNALKASSYSELVKEDVISTIVTFRRVVGITFTLLLSFILNFIIGYTIGNYLKNGITAQILNILILTVTLIWSEQLIDPNNSEFYNSILGFGYLVPQKYLTWLLYFFYIDIETSLDFINLIIINLSVDLFFKNYNLILPIIAFQIFIITAINYNYSNVIVKVKKWKRL
ncbi:hypothetical protein SCORR_v1c06360 [Spiroplasma corruscae]|uniref:Uncharacterized protein n=1 Tax=Spiroplasma corruscae TaxID=216934 RepID=A0A222EPG1_9MOLU|nr:hypothetical protein [Spiroplasma corruscae]ASP28408.1 hypothetical protein SCORR_v1c06360 [Spiroplasma corruscae]